MTNKDATAASHGGRLPPSLFVIRHSSFVIQGGIMPSGKPISFGYHPPTGDRGIEKIDPATFVRDVYHVMDVAKPYFSWFWVSDHLMTHSGFREECWTQLTWLAARYPDQ